MSVAIPTLKRDSALPASLSVGARVIMNLLISMETLAGREAGRNMQVGQGHAQGAGACLVGYQLVGWAGCWPWGVVWGTACRLALCSVWLIRSWLVRSWLASSFFQFSVGRS